MAISSFTTRDCLQELGYRIAECRAVEQYIYEKQDESTLIGFKMLHCTSAFFVKYFVDDRKALFLKKTETELSALKKLLSVLSSDCPLDESFSKLKLDHKLTLLYEYIYFKI